GAGGAAAATGGVGALGVLGPAAATGKARVNRSDAVMSKLRNPIFFMPSSSKISVRTSWPDTLRGKSSALQQKRPAHHVRQPQYSQTCAECFSSPVTFPDAPRGLISAELARE